MSELNQGAASLQTKIEQALDSVNITITSERDARADDLNNFRKELEDKTNTLVEGVSHLKSTSGRRYHLPNQNGNDTRGI